MIALASVIVAVIVALPYPSKSICAVESTSITSDVIIPAPSPTITGAVIDTPSDSIEAYDSASIVPLTYTIAGIDILSFASVLSATPASAVISPDVMNTPAP